MENAIYNIAIIGTGFVADLYVRSFKASPEVEIVCAFDIDAARLVKFCDYWKINKAKTVDDLLSDKRISLILNLTNPASHYEVSKYCLEAGKHVYSEKPLALEMNHAYELFELAKENDLMIGSAPCSFLSETAQTLRYALEAKKAGKPYLIYAELDDDFISKAPYKKWKSESGAPWPYKDEFEVGCTIEHAGYYLTWLMMIFGTVETVVSATANLVDNSLISDKVAPDFSTAILYFKSGVVARLTCSIIATHDHKIRIFCENGVLSVKECWNNTSSVFFKSRKVIRRRLINNPFSKKIKLPGPTHPKVGKFGAASMNFALGPVDMLKSISENGTTRMSSKFALHLNEVTLAINNPGRQGKTHTMKTTMPNIEPMPWAKIT
ncbi:MAG: oxidoreductase [Gammaproteobacteria bacterium]|nr:MAG: oxidoreductase [Gammaproteobacteria bacterium]